jgi:glycerol-3-phosphate cytidylyltransferase
VGNLGSLDNRTFKTSKTKRVMVDMSATIIHHGHIRILKAAHDLGVVVVALTADDEILKTKGYIPELIYSEREEILLAIKYVNEVVKSKWLIDDEFLDKHNIDLLVHGHDNSNPIRKERLVIIPRTEGISSRLIRKSHKFIE